MAYSDSGLREAKEELGVQIAKGKGLFGRLNLIGSCKLFADILDESIPLASHKYGKSSI